MNCWWLKIYLFHLISIKLLFSLNSIALQSRHTRPDPMDTNLWFSHSCACSSNLSFCRVLYVFFIKNKTFFFSSSKSSPFSYFLHPNSTVLLSPLHFWSHTQKGLAYFYHHNLALCVWFYFHDEAQSFVL